jgi:hypothetical protein
MLYHCSGNYWTKEDHQAPEREKKY